MSQQSKQVEDINTQQKHQEASQISKALGLKIQKARIALKKTLEDVSLDLKIQTKYLQQIEDGKSSDMPSSFYYLSFIKSYIHYLKLDTGDLYTRLSTYYQHISDYTGDSLGILMQSRYNRQSLSLMLSAGVLLLIVFTFAFFYLLYRESGNDNTQEEIVISSQDDPVIGNQISIIASEKTYITLTNGFKEVIFSDYIKKNETKNFYVDTGVIMKTDQVENITVFVNGVVLSKLINNHNNSFTILRGPMLVKVD